MLTDSMPTGELLAILFVATCVLIALAYVVSLEIEEADYYKTWEKQSDLTQLNCYCWGAGVYSRRYYWIWHCCSLGVV